MSDRLTDEELRAIMDFIVGLRRPLTGNEITTRRLAAEVLELRARVAALEARERIGSHGAGTTI